jgi:uncharacterized repeat protein (TIGR03803 family)
MNSPMRSRTTPSRRRAVSAALPLAIMLALVACPSAQSQTFTSLYVFTGGADGGHPSSGGLIRDAKGNLYGTTEDDGANGFGTVFEMNTSGTESVLYSFRGTGGDGAYPIGGLVVDSQGNFYGTTFEGGAYGYGTVFKLDTTGAETVLYSFTGTGGDGAYPGTSLVRDAAGSLYGTTTEGGGTSSSGTVFKLDATGKETVLYSFAGGRDGSYPSYGVLIRDSVGNLYGTTVAGGVSGNGTVFKVGSTGTETLLYSFPGGAKGGHPLGGLTRDAKGNLYGTTWLGGAHHNGAVFRLNTSGQETVLYSFTGGPDGGGPAANVIRDKKGNLYGTRGGGGALTLGTVFELDGAGKETVLHSFTLGSDGGLPCAGLVRDAAGNLYGTAPIGGGPPNYYNDGTVFSLAPAVSSLNAVSEQ